MDTRADSQHLRNTLIHRVHLLSILERSFLRRSKRDIFFTPPVCFLIIPVCGIYIYVAKGESRRPLLCNPSSLQGSILRPVPTYYAVFSPSVYNRIWPLMYICCVHKSTRGDSSCRCLGQFLLNYESVCVSSPLLAEICRFADLQVCTSHCGVSSCWKED